MKKSILSILLVLALCLSLLPTTALADDTDPSGSPTTITTTCTHTSATQKEDGSYICANEECGKTLIAEVTSTTEGGTATYYLAATGATEPQHGEEDDVSLIAAAFRDPSTKVKLLADVKTVWTSALGSGIVFCYSNQTLDLNGHLLDTHGAGIDLSFSDDDNPPTPSLTITDSSTAKTGELKADVRIYAGSLTIDSGTLTALTVDRSTEPASLYAAPSDTGLIPGTIEISGGAMTISGTAQIDCSTITVAGYTDNDTGITTPDSLTVRNRAKITGGITVGNNGTLTMTGGTVKMRQSSSNPSFDPLDNSVKVYVSGGTANISGGRIELLEIQSGTAKISGGSIDDVLVVTCGSVELSGGTYKGVSAYGSATDLLKNGYAYYAKATETSTDYTKLTEPTTVDQVSMVENVAVKTHECSFSADPNVAGRWACGCGRTSAVEPIAYVDKDGTTAYCMEYTVLDKSYVENHTSENSKDLAVGEQAADRWYVVKNDLTVNGKMNIDGLYAGLHLILCDGATLTVAGISGSNTNSMTIYGQRGGTGKLVTKDPTTGENRIGYGIQVSNGLTVNGGEIEAAAPNAEFGYGIYVYGDLTVNGGTVTATGGKTTVAENETTGKNYYGIYVYEGDVTVNGGTVTATGGEIRGKYDEYGRESLGMRVNYGGIKVTGGTVNATGGKVSITHPAGDPIKYAIGGSCGIAADYAKLTVSGGTVTATGSDVSVTGDSVRYADSYGVCIYGDVEVSGSGTLDCTGGAALASGNGHTDVGDFIQGDSFGLYVDEYSYRDENRNYIYAGGAVKVSGGKLKAAGGNVSVTKTDAVAGSDWSDSEGLSVYNKLTVSGGTVELSHGTATLDGGASDSTYERDLATDELEVSGGTMKLKKSYLGSPIIVSGSVKLANLLADSYAYWQKEFDEDWNLLSSGFLKLAGLTNATALNADNTVYYIDLCTHSSTSGVCEYCGKNLTPATNHHSSSSTPSANTETTTTPDGSTIRTETKNDGTVIETVMSPDGSTKKTETKTETKKDGTTVETKKETFAGKDGTSSTTEIKTETKADGSSAEIRTETASSPDGTKTETKTETKTSENGEISTTDTKKITVSDGSSSTTTTVTDKNGSTTTSNVSISSQAAQDAQKSGEAVTLPIEVGAGKSGGSQTTVQVDLPADSGALTVEIPVSDVTPGTVAILVNEDGSETVVPLSKVTENGIQITLEKSATIKLTDNSRSFSDVKDSDFFSDAVQWAASRGITDGIDSDQFGPGLRTSRAQLVTFLWRAAGCPVASFAMNFSDADEDSFYTEAVRWAASLGIIGGYGNGSFGAGDDVTREQMAAILYRFAQSVGMDTTQGGMAVREFEDYDSISDYALDAVCWAVNAGIMQGADGKLMPSDTCTRSQIVTMLYRLLGE